MSLIRNLLVVTPALLGSVTEGFWRMRCPGIAGLSRMDPLVSPGEPAAHIHAFFGSSSLGISSTNEDLVNGNCTSCQVTQDKSGYWQPALYFHDDDTGKTEYVGIKGDTGEGNAGILAYYKLLNNHGTQETGITAFPPGFRMIAGSSTLRTPPKEVGDRFMEPDPPKSDWAALGQDKQDILAWRAIGFNCMHDPGSGFEPEPTLFRHYLPAHAEIKENRCDSLRTELVFPSCWNGVDVDSEEHNKHVVYPLLSEDGACPEGFTTRVPTLLYEAIWDTKRFNDRNGHFLLSNGDKTGFGMHADFMNGWDQNVLEEAVNTCHSSSGHIEDCPVFNIQSQAEAAQCKLEIPEDLVEDVKGPFSVLPGHDLLGDEGSVGIAQVDGTDKPLAALNALSPELLSEVELSSKTSVEFTTLVEPTIPVEPAILVEPTTPVEPIVPLEQTMDQDIISATSSDTTKSANSTPSVESGPDATANYDEQIVTEAPSLPEDEQMISYSVVTTEFRTEGNLVYEIIWEEALVFVTEDFTSTVTVSTGPNSLRRAKRDHQHSHYGANRRHI